MESAYGGQAIGVYGGMAAGENEMGAFLDAMQERYGLESVTNFIDNYLNKYLDEVEFPNPAQGLGILTMTHKQLLLVMKHQLWDKK